MLDPTSLDRVFHALADVSRRAIVEQLVRGPRTVSELATPLGLSLAAIGHHLRALEEGGVIRSTKAGRTRTCHIEPAAMADVERWIGARRMDSQRRLDRLERFLSQHEDADMKKEKKR